MAVGEVKAGSDAVATFVFHNAGTEDVKIIKISHPGVGFEKASEDAVRQWRFRPAAKLGTKVRMWISVRIPFTMR